MGEVVQLFGSNQPKPPYEMRVWQLYSGDTPLCWEVARVPHHMDWIDPLAHFATAAESVAWAREYAGRDDLHWFSGEVG